MPKKLPPRVPRVSRQMMRQLFGWELWVIDKSVTGHLHTRNRTWSHTFYHTAEKAGFTVKTAASWSPTYIYTEVDLSDPERITEWAWEMGYLSERDYNLLLAEITLRLAGG